MKRYSTNGEVKEPEKKYKGGGNAVGSSNQLTKEYADYLRHKTGQQLAKEVEELKGLISHWPNSHVQQIQKCKDIIQRLRDTCQKALNGEQIREYSHLMVEVEELLFEEPTKPISETNWCHHEGKYTSKVNSAGRVVCCKCNLPAREEEG